jgi:FPC/CPF motif-containing protein YcgG
MNQNTSATDLEIEENYHSFLNNRLFPCIAAKAALARQQIYCMVAGHMGCTRDDLTVLDFLYDFIEKYRLSHELYHSATVIFREPVDLDEDQFDNYLWQRLQSLAHLDAERYAYDSRVNADPVSPFFSYSLKEEALFIIGLHPQSSRLTRRFSYPTLVFNPHQQFQALKQQNHFESMKEVVRKRDMHFSGSINPMLDDFGSSSEVLQYSGRMYPENWTCPLHITHAITNNNSTP